MANKPLNPDLKLKEVLSKVDWLCYNIEYGNVKLQIRNGRLTLLAVERTSVINDKPNP